MKMAATSGDRSDDELNDTFGELNLQPRRLAVRRHPSSGLQDAIQYASQSQSISFLLCFLGA